MNKIIEEDVITITNNIEYEKLQGKNILITGATGMLASYVVFLLHYLNEVKQMDIGIWLLLRNEKKAKIKFGDQTRYSGCRPYCSSAADGRNCQGHFS